MADVLERARRRSAPRSDARETLEPLLDELMRSLGFERAAVLLYDEDRAALAGRFGIGVPDAIARELVIPLALADDPVVAVLRGGLPARIRDATTDERISPAIRNTLAQARLGPIVAAPLRSTTEGGQVRPDGKGSATAGWEHRGEWAGVVLLSRRSGVTQSDVDALVPFARQAEEALSQQRDVDLLRDTSEAHAIEKEWLWWMVNGVGDAVLVTDSNNDMVLQNRRAELLFRAGDEDSAGKRRAVWMNNFLFTAALSTWNLERIGATTSREVTLVDPIEGDELIYEVITTPATNFRVGMRGTVSVLKNVTDIRHIGEELARGRQRLQSAEEEIHIERDRLGHAGHRTPSRTGAAAARAGAVRFREAGGHRAARGIDRARDQQSARGRAERPLPSAEGARRGREQPPVPRHRLARDAADVADPPSDARLLSPAGRHGRDRPHRPRGRRRRSR